MKRFANIAALAAFAHVALAAEPQFVGKPDCRIADMAFVKGAEVSWTGGCKEGFADGDGKVEFTLNQKILVRYVGQVHRGMPDGEGYIARHDGAIYEGGFKEGESHGKGVGSGWWGTYEGEYRNGAHDGYGRAVFALGGSYEGEWKGGKFHGKGTATYPSGRVFTGEFVDGRPAGEPAPATSDERFKLWTDNAAKGWMGTSDAKIAFNLTVPADKRYDELTPAQQAWVRSWYPLLDKDDEPPYPAEGTQDMVTRIWRGLGKAGDDGVVQMLIDVDSTGKVTNVAVTQTPNKATARLVMTVALRQQFKPALCAGKPCAMKFPFGMKITME